MNVHGAAQGKHTDSASELYMAFELGEKSWKLSLSDGARGPSRYTLTAGDTATVLECIVKTKARCGLSLEARVRSCYEAGRDGFWLHRWLIAQGIDNLVVDSASIEVNRRARAFLSDRGTTCAHLCRNRPHLSSRCAPTCQGALRPYRR